MEHTFLPVFAVNRFNLIRKLDAIQGDFGVLGTTIESDNFLNGLRQLGKPLFIDSGVFETGRNAWYQTTLSVFQDGRWIRENRLSDVKLLKKWIGDFLDRCEKFDPDYVFAPDILNEPILSLYLARLAWEIYSSKNYGYQLIGVVQVGHSLYNWQSTDAPQLDGLPPYFSTAKSFLSPLISEYRNLGYQYVALGGLLKADSTMPTGLKFGLSNEKLDDLLGWSRPNFVLGGLALSRLEILKKHNVWADSSNWLWWDKRYDFKRFGHRNVLQEVVN
jgi:hypothetical protein